MRPFSRSRKALSTKRCIETPRNVGEVSPALSRKALSTKRCIETERRLTRNRNRQKSESTEHQKVH